MNHERSDKKCSSYGDKIVDRADCDRSDMFDAQEQEKNVFEYNKYVPIQQK